MRRTLAIIGPGMVAQKLLDLLRRREVTAGWDIVVIGEESRPAYDRVHLSSMFDGASSDDLDLHGASGDHPAVTVHVGDAATALDLARRRVHTASGVVVDYDVAVLATGSSPWVPPVPGRIGVHAATTILGVEAGAAGTVSSVRLAPANGAPEAPATVVPAGLVVFSAGIRPRDELARAAGLAVAANGGCCGRRLLPDQRPCGLRHRRVRSGRGRAGVRPGVSRLPDGPSRRRGARKDAAFASADTDTRLKLLGVEMASFGVTVDTGDLPSVRYTDDSGLIHRRLLLAPDGRIVGGILVGDIAGYDTLVQMARGRCRPRRVPDPWSAPTPRRCRASGRGPSPSTPGSARASRSPRVPCVPPSPRPSQRARRRRSRLSRRPPAPAPVAEAACH